MNGSHGSDSSVAPPLGLIERPAFAETIVDLGPGDAFLFIRMAYSAPRKPDDRG